jgi:hypothetical protein
VWGANDHAGEFTHSLLAESEAVLDEFNTVLGRAEFVQKGAAELGIDQAPLGFASNERFNVVALSAGYIRELVRVPGATIGLGGMGTVNVVPPSLDPVYGSRTPLGGTVFLRLRPSIRRGMGSMHDMGDHE